MYIDFDPDVGTIRAEQHWNTIARDRAFAGLIILVTRLHGMTDQDAVDAAWSAVGISHISMHMALDLAA